MKVIFLDIDGVLNNSEFFSRGGDARNELDKINVKNLNFITSNVPGVKIVLSSSWRLLHTLEWMRDFLKAQGVEGELIDATPGPTVKTKSGIYLASSRGEEIGVWLKQHPEVESFIAIDDTAGDMKEVQDRLVHTNFSNGLTVHDSEKAVELLN